MAYLASNQEVIMLISPINIKSITVSRFMRKHSTACLSKNPSVHQAAAGLKSATISLISLHSFLIR